MILDLPGRGAATTSLPSKSSRAAASGHSQHRPMPAQSRRSHAKSRRGCSACKKAHVKCDESGPPCDRCKFRGTGCEYGDNNNHSLGPANVHAHKESVRPSSADTRATDDPSSSDTTFVSSNTAIDPALDRVKIPVFPTDRRLLELQLMHRWTSTTYQSCCTPGSGDDEVWQLLVPTLALEYDYLLYGVLALTAFDIARLLVRHDDLDHGHYEEYKRYVNAAVIYHGNALGRFRAQLPLVVDRDGNFEAALCMSLLLMILALASTQFISKSAGSNETNSEHNGRDSMVQNAITHFELVRGCVPVMEIKPDYIDSNPYLRKLPRYEDIPRTPLDARTEAVFEKLRDMNDLRISSSVFETGIDERTRVNILARWEACKGALASLRECFEKCSGGIEDRETETNPDLNKVHQAFALGWLNMAGEGYIQALKEGDTVALLMLMYWGVLMEPIGRHVWWAERVGTLLVGEISERILQQAAEEARVGNAINGLDDSTREVVSWARDLVNLAPTGKEW